MKRSVFSLLRTEPPGGTASAGFSLIEMLATLLLSAMLLGAFLPFIAQLQASWTRGQSTVTETDQLATGFSRLTTDLASALPWIDRTSPVTPPPLFFYGSPSSVLFVRQANEGGIRPQLEEVLLEITSAGQSQSLIRRRRLLAGHKPTTNPTLMQNPVTLLTTPGEMHFTFIDSSGGSGNLSTEISWSPGPALPSRVELIIEHDPGMPAHKLPLPILADLAAGCLVANAPPDACPSGSAPAAPTAANQAPPPTNGAPRP